MLKLFRRKKDLREVCRKKYGEEFVEQYDKLNCGIPIGNLEETKHFLEMLEETRREVDDG